MKMSGYWRLTVLFTLLGVLLGARAQQTVLKLVGSEVTLEPKYTGNPTEINWKINGDKLVDMELNSQDEPIFYRLQDRATIDRTNGRLTIKNLTTEDSGFYRAEVLVNSIYQYTDITLTVRACPDEPNITDQSTEENIVLYCESSTPGVTYKWFNQTESVGNKQSYSEPRPENDVTLTCVVYNEVCKKNSSIIIPYTPPPAQQTVLKAVGTEVIMKPKYTGNPSEINWKINGNRLVDMEVIPPDEPPVFYHLQDRASIDRTNGVLTIKDLTIEDSGDYTAEVLVNNNYQYTDITLTVRACPDEPNITDRTTEENILLYCESSTPGVTYEWFTWTGSVGNEQSYSEPRPEHDVTLTCVVGNEVCEKNSNIIIPYIPPEKSIPGWVIALIVVLVLVPVLIVLIGVCYEFRDHGCMNPIYSFITNENESRVAFFRNVHSRIPCFKGNAPDVERDPRLERSPCITVKFPTKDQPKGKVKTRLTIHDVKPEEHHYYVLKVLQSDGKKDVIAIKETDGVVTIKTEDDRVTLTVPDTEKVTKLTWKKCGITLFQWAGSSLKLYTNNITLKPGFVTVNNAEGEGSYKVEVHSTDNHITNNIMQLEANNQGNESPTNRKEDLEEVEMALLTKKGLPEPIGSVTFHPNIISSNTTLKKDGELLNIDNDNRLTLSLYGDLTIDNVTSDDGGKYTIQCDDQEQEFILGL